MRFRRAFAVLLLAALAALGATALLPERVSQVARAVEKVRGRRFDRAVPASEIGAAELKRILKSKVSESFPASAEDTFRTLVALGLIDETPKLMDKMLDFYASKAIAYGLVWRLGLAKRERKTRQRERRVSGWEVLDAA